jgi:hypothetical protein
MNFAQRDGRAAGAIMFLSSGCGSRSSTRGVYLYFYEAVYEARTSIGKYLEFDHSGRPRSSLDGFTPDQVYFNCLPESSTAQTKEQNFHV